MRHLFFLVVATALLLLLACSSSSPFAHAMTFTLVPGNTKCFTEELSTSHRVHLDYSMPQARSLFTSVYITSPDGRHIYDEKRNTHKNRHVFHPTTQGEYAVCFVSIEKRSAVPNFEITVTLLAEFEVQTQKSLDYESTKTQDNQKNKALMVQAKYASDNLLSIHEDFMSHMEREGHLRVTTETAFTRSNVFSIFTLLIIAGVTYFGYLTLKRHLVAKRILD